MELTAKQKAARLRMAMEALHNADAWIQAALGDSDVCYDMHCQIENLIDDLRCDIVEFDNA